MILQAVVGIVCFCFLVVFSFPFAYTPLTLTARSFSFHLVFLARLQQPQLPNLLVRTFCTPFNRTVKPDRSPFKLASVAWTGGPNVSWKSCPQQPPIRSLLLFVLRDSLKTHFSKTCFTGLETLLDHIHVSGCKWNSCFDESDRFYTNSYIKQEYKFNDWFSTYFQKTQMLVI